MPNQLVVRRIITYRGYREWLEKTLARSIQGTKFINGEKATISAVSLDPFPIPVGPSLMKQFYDELTAAEKFYPGDDSMRDGYKEGVQACIDLFNEYLSEG